MKGTASQSSNITVLITPPPNDSNSKLFQYVLTGMGNEFSNQCSRVSLILILAIGLYMLVSTLALIITFNFCILMNVSL